jgi:hypothetical protein
MIKRAIPAFEWPKEEREKQNAQLVKDPGTTDAVRSVTHLALVLRNTDIGPEEFERLMKQQADIFWETLPTNH